MVLTLKVLLKDAQRWKEYLINNGLFDSQYSLTKDGTYIYYPVKKRFDILKRNVEFVESRLKRRIIKQDLKSTLKDELSPKELVFLRSAHDVVGDIAILEIPKELIKKEKIIAQKLLDTNQNIKTVLKKSSSHTGRFRTQKMKHLGGEKRKKTIYKENNSIMELDVEKVYFSARLSNERKRINSMIRKGEEVLVMFSGCAPYPLVFSKNSEAMNITGIEINPEGHKYAIRNQFLNKASNMILVNEDVKKAAPNIYKNIVGLKSSIDAREFNARLKNHPQIFELSLRDNELFEDLPTIEKRLKTLKSKGISAFIHMPYRIYDKNHDYKKQPKNRAMAYYNFSGANIARELEMLKMLGELCKKHDAKAIIHMNDPGKQIDKKILVENLSTLEKYFDHFYFETLTGGFSGWEPVLEIGKAAGIKNVCIDLSHLYIIYGDNRRMVEAIRKIKSEFNTYFHITDNNGITHTCELGKGKIDFNKIAPLITTGVIEIQCKDNVKAEESIHSWNYLNGLSKLKKYDRIVMPLPKTADEFLDSALMLSKKGTIIHFYDFLEENNFSEAKNKIEKACKKHSIRYKIRDMVKCGQQSPYVYRICVDFEIM
jgi:tRNA (guanine37-N1)-methyltransferase